MMNKKGMSGKDQIIDFSNFVFLIAVGLFMLFYVVFGDRMDAFAEILKVLMFFSVFAFLFLLVSKINHTKIIKLIENEKNNEDIAYIDKTDILIDKIVALVLVVIIIGIALFDGEINTIDYVQAISSALVYFAWHRFLFKNKEGADMLIVLNEADKAKDEIVIFLIPVLILVPAVFSGVIDVVDNVQAVASFLIVAIWHYKLFIK